MQQIKPATRMLFIAFLLTGLPIAVVSQTDTITFNGQMYARITSAGMGNGELLNSSHESRIPATAGMKEGSVNIKAVRHFKKRYKDAVAERWMRATDGFNVKFHSSDMVTTVKYSFSGKWLNTVKRYHEANLPPEIRALIKPVYYDYSIVVIYEWTENNFPPGIPIYYVHLKHGLTYKILRVLDHEMEEFQSFQLQK